MKAIDKLVQIIKKHHQPRVNVVLMLPDEIINKGWKDCVMSTDGLEFFGCYGLFKNQYLFKGKIKVDLK